MLSRGAPSQVSDVQLDLLEAIRAAGRGTRNAYVLESMLEATDAVRDAFGAFVEATVVEEAS